MTTKMMTLSEYAELLTNLAESWDGEEPVVAIGDRTGNVNVTLNDGYTKHGTVGYANEVFGDNPVHTIGNGDTRFYGTMLFSPNDLPDETVEQVREADYRTDVGGGGGDE